MRVSDEALFRQFPWLREKAKRNEILKAGKAFLKKTNNFEKEEINPKAEATLRATKNLLRALTVTDSNPSVVRTELNKLEGQVEAGEIEHDGEEEYNVMAPDGSLVLEIGAMLPELELAYDLAENNLPKRSLIILDSIEALSEIYGISAVRIMNVLQKDLVEHSDTNIIYVLETSGKSIMDYLGDGVLILDSGERGGRRIRQLISRSCGEGASTAGSTCSRCRADASAFSTRIRRVCRSPRAGTSSSRTSTRRPYPSAVPRWTGSWAASRGAA